MSDKEDVIQEKKNNFFKQQKKKDDETVKKVFLRQECGDIVKNGFRSLRSKWKGKK